MIETVLKLIQEFGYVQLVICISTMITSYFINRGEPEKRMIAGMVGLFNQPFWFYESYVHNQWGYFILSFWFTRCWLKGLLINYKLYKNEKERVNYETTN